MVYMKSRGRSTVRGIAVDGLTKTYRVPIRSAGLVAALRSVCRPRFHNVEAVRGIGFEIEPGEIVGMLGPNGSGKTTTLKMLTGLLHPSAGQVMVEGYVPYHRQPEFLRRISLVMGNKSQLTWDNTVQDSFLIHRAIYGVSIEEYRQRSKELIDLLELDSVLRKHARNLSLGERAKCQLAMALLHQPDVLFLDEPTLGLDVSMQIRFRTFIKEYNRRHGTTILLTSHYMSDIVSLCPRVIMIQKGDLFYDGRLSEIASRTAPFKLIDVSTRSGERLPRVRSGV